MWNSLWYFVIYFFVCGTRSGILCYIIPRVERALVLWNYVLYFSACGKRSGILCYLFFAFLFILCWIIPTLISPKSFFSSCLKLYLIYALWYCRIMSYIFACGTHSSLWNLMLYFSACGTHSGIVECCVVFFWLRNILLYCGILCYICLHLERALVLWNIVLYLSVRGTCSYIVKFRVIFLCVWNALWYCGIYCYIYLRVKHALVL